MQVGREPGLHAPIIFDGQGRICTEDGQLVIDAMGVHDPRYIAKDGDASLMAVRRDDFELLCELGKGQYGSVWSVKHLPTSTMMAIKIVGLTLSENAMKQILTELDILMRARSPFIVKCFGAFCSEVTVYFCMELLGEGSLESFMRRHNPRGVRLENALRAVAYSVICALKFLRDSFAVIHRDVKPSNVLVGSDGCVKICDFGVSGYLAQSLARTRVGTSNYMAPERISLGGNELGGGGYGVKADVWSLGASLMELATGSPPFPLTNYECIFAQLMDIIYSDSPRMPRDQGLDEDLCDFVDACLLKDPKERPSYADLLKHPFLHGVDEEKARMFMRECMGDNCTK